MYFSGKVAIVTQAGNDIGKAICQMFCEEGASTILVDKDKDVIEQMAKELSDNGYKAQAAIYNMSEWSDAESLFRFVIEEYGDVSYLVNGTDPVNREPADIEGVSLEHWNQIINEEMTKVFHCSQIAGRIMKDRSFGKIINIASMDVFKPSAVANPAYASAKGAVVNMTRTFARDLSPFGINVNCIAPGNIRSETDLNTEEYEMAVADIAAKIPLRRLGYPWEVAKLVKFLCSEDSAFITGQTVDINGGFWFR